MAKKEKQLFVRCQHCGGEFVSMFQLPESASVVFEGNTESCPHCKRATLSGDHFWKELPKKYTH